MGGRRFFTLTCEYCNKKYIGSSINRKRCDECKLKKRCIRCNKEFESKYSNHCQDCLKSQFWLKERDWKAISEKAQKTKRNWLRSEEAKEFYKKLGRKNSQFLKKHYKTDEGKKQLREMGKKQSIIMKNKIADGSWTPCITNTWTHWNAVVTVNRKQFKFRSSWEACFWFSNQYLEYETIRVPLKSSYVICDFVDREKKIVYEIKPKSRYRKEKHKMNAIIDWCLSNGYKFIWVNDFNILQYIDQSKFRGENKKQLEKLLEGIGYAKG